MHYYFVDFLASLLWLISSYFTFFLYLISTFLTALKLLTVKASSKLFANNPSGVLLIVGASGLPVNSMFSLNTNFNLYFYIKKVFYIFLRIKQCMISKVIKECLDPLQTKLFNFSQLRDVGLALMF